MKRIGFTWLVEKYKIKGFMLSHESYIGSTDKTEITSKNTITRTFKPKYDVGADDPFSHIEFALKYDDLNLALIKEIFQSIGHEEIERYVQNKANRKYTRIIGFLYEFVTSESLVVDVKVTNYQDVLDSSRYIVGEVIKNPKWKVNDNLLGSKNFCPIIRRTAELTQLLEWDAGEAIGKLKEAYSPEIFKRASYYLYKKESKSSSEIESENPPKDRMDKFIAFLENAGNNSFEESLSEEELVRVQNEIVDSRYADKGFRGFQNYIGQTLRDYTQKIHYVCPPPEYVKSLMQGLIELNEKNVSTHPIIKAAMTSFGFVYVHPFEDGNGRIHRYLIHDVLVRNGVVPTSTIIPVSAKILAKMNEYDETLEILSKQIDRKVKYELDENDSMTVHNAREIEALYRFPDFTNHSVFLIKAIQSTVNEDVPEELIFLQQYDTLKKEIQLIVDMPDKKLDRMIHFLHQNNGQLASRKQKFFSELTDAEIRRMELAYKQVFVKSHK